jgi:hypothetical protein
MEIGDIAYLARLTAQRLQPREPMKRRAATDV